MAPKAFEAAEKLIQSLQPVPISDNLEDLHPFVRNTRKVFKRQQKKKYYRIDYNRVAVSEAGIFTIKIGHNRIDSWTDGKTKSIESRNDEIIHQLIFVVAWKKEYVAFQKKIEEEWKIEQEKRAQKEKLAGVERERVSQLEA